MPLVSIVTYNSEAYLGPCLESVRKQTLPCQIKVFDNASSDASTLLAAQHGATITQSEKNIGFSAGHNRNLQDLRSDFALLLNPDVCLQPDFVEILINSISENRKIGMAGGKLLRMGNGGAPLMDRGFPLLDSTGIYFTPSQRHFDRGNGEADVGQFDKPQIVFGITGAALLCRREMLADLQFEAEYLDADFFAYREDADLAWRAQLHGWHSLYEPTAVGLHARNVLPSNRRQLDPLINFHSLKNRYLLRIKNMDRAVRRRCMPYMWLRDIGILGYVLFRERSSLGAYSEVRRLRPRMELKRQKIQNGRTAAPASIAKWFRFRPVAFDYSR